VCSSTVVYCVKEQDSDSSHCDSSSLTHNSGAADRPAVRCHLGKDCPQVTDSPVHLVEHLSVVTSRPIAFTHPRLAIEGRSCSPHAGYAYSTVHSEEGLSEHRPAKSDVCRHPAVEAREVARTLRSVSSAHACAACVLVYPASHLSLRPPHVKDI
jgi:hypothetical protein